MQQYFCDRVLLVLKDGMVAKYLESFFTLSESFIDRLKEINVFTIGKNQTFFTLQ